jgi:hypothetical protein
MDAETVLLMGDVEPPSTHGYNETRVPLLDRVIALSHADSVDTRLLRLGVDLLFSPEVDGIRDRRLEELAPVLPPELLREVLARSRVIGDGWERARAVVALLSRQSAADPASLVTELLESPHTRHSYGEEEAMLDVYDWLGPAELQRWLSDPAVAYLLAPLVKLAADRSDYSRAWRLLEAAAGTVQRLDALSALGASAVANGVAEQVEACWQAMREATLDRPPTERAVRLLPLASGQPPAVRADLLDAVRAASVDAEFNSWGALVDVLDRPTLESEWRSLASRAAALPDTNARVWALTHLASRLGGADAAALAREALASLSNVRLRSWHLEDLAPLLDQEHHTRALDLALHSPDAQERAESLRSLAPVLGEADLRRGIAATGDFDTTWKDYAPAGSPSGWPGWVTRMKPSPAGATLPVRSNAAGHWADSPSTSPVSCCPRP